MNTRIILLGALFLLLSLSNAFADDLVSDLTITVDGRQVTNDTIWISEYTGQTVQEKNIGPSLEVKSTCRNVNGTAGNIVLTLYPAGGAFARRTFLGEADTQFVLKNIGEFGNYIIEANCTYLSQSAIISKTFTVHKLELFFQNSDSVQGEIGFEGKVPVIFKVDGKLISDRSNFLIRLKDSNHTYQSSLPEYVESIGGDYIDLAFKIPYDIPEGKRTIEVVGNYEGDKTITIGKSIEIESPITLDIENESISCKANEYCSFDLQVLVDSNGPKPLSEYSSENFIVGIYRNEDKDLFDYPTITRVDCNENTKRCVLRLITDIKIVPGIYTLKISAIDNQLGSAPKYTEFVSSYFLQGVIKNAENNAISSKMTFLNKDTSSVISKEFTGAYFMEVFKGSYDLNINFQGGALIADIYNASFENTLIESGRNINFDSFENKEVLTGVHTVRVVVLELGFDFESASLKIPYSNLNIYNEENLGVYRCTNWNFGMRKCNGNWTRVEGTKVNAVADTVEVETDVVSAFLLGEKKFIHFNTIGTPAKEAGLGGIIPVEGQVLDSDGQEVSGVIITLRVQNYTSTTETVADGSFLGYVTLPYREGMFNIKVSAEKEPYVSAEQEVVIKTVKTEELTVMLPEAEVPVTLDEPKTISFTIVNPGQVDVSDLRININGLSLKSYKLVPDTINKLGPGETKEITLDVNMTSEDCGEKCEQYISVIVDVRGKTEGTTEITAGGTFIIELKKPQSAALESEGILSNLSGLFTLPNMSGENAIAGILLVAIAIVIFLIIRKKSDQKTYKYPYTNKGLNIPRSSNIMTSMRTIKSEVKEKKK